MTSRFMIPLMDEENTNSHQFNDNSYNLKDIRNDKDEKILKIYLTEVLIRYHTVILSAFSILYPSFFFILRNRFKIIKVQKIE